MTIRPARSSVVILLLAAGCSPAANPSATASAPTSASASATPSSDLPESSLAPTTSANLIDAINLAPRGLLTIEFTDWSLTKAQAGFPDLSGDSPQADRDAFLLTMQGTINPPAPPTEFAAGTLARFARFQRDRWGFDILDLEWEAAEFANDGTRAGSATIIRFPEGFDLDPLLALLDERGYTSQVRNGVTIRSHDYSSEPWANAWLEMLNVAIYPDQRTLALSSLPDALDPFVDAAADPDDSREDRQPFITAAEALDDPSTAYLSDGAHLCTMLDPGNMPVPEVVQAELAAASPLNLYATLGIGYARAHDPIGRMVFAYGLPTTSAADLAGRQGLATSGHSVQSEGRTYSEFFTVEDAVVDGVVLRLELTPHSDSPRYLFLGVFLRDMSYAACAL